MRFLKEIARWRLWWESAARGFPTVGTKWRWPASIGLGLGAMLFGWSALALNPASPNNDESVAPAKGPVFEKDTLPIFTGSSAGPVVVPTAPEASQLPKVLRGTMPFDRKTQVLLAETETLRLWMGALAASGGSSQPGQSNQTEVGTTHPSGSRLSPASPYRAVLDR